MLGVLPLNYIPSCWGLVMCTVYLDSDFCAQTSGYSLDNGMVKHLWSQRYVKVVFNNPWLINKELIGLWPGRRGQQRWDIGSQVERKQQKERKGAEWSCGDTRRTLHRTHTEQNTPEQDSNGKQWNIYLGINCLIELEYFRVCSAEC